MSRRGPSRLSGKGPFLCSHCGETKPESEFRVRRRNGKLFSASACHDCDDIPAKLNYATVRLDVLTYYSFGQMVCACCGESEVEFLCIDHIEGNGGQHRREIGRMAGANFYRWLRDNEFPSGFQVLCNNCNMAKNRAGGVCPHQRNAA